MEDISRLLDWVLYIYYPFYFCKDKKNKIKALINLDSKVNTMTPTYTLKLSVKVRFTDVRAQKIDGSMLKMFEMVLVNFQVKNKLERVRFF